MDTQAVEDRRGPWERILGIVVVAAVSFRRCCAVVSSSPIIVRAPPSEAQYAPALFFFFGDIWFHARTGVNPCVYSTSYVAWYLCSVWCVLCSPRMHHPVSSFCSTRGTFFEANNIVRCHAKTMTMAW